MKGQSFASSSKYSGMSYKDRNWREPRSLTDSDLLSVITGSVVNDFMAKYGNSLGEIAKLSVSDMTRMPGMGRHKAYKIAAAFELGRRRSTEKAMDKNHISTSLDIYDIFHPQLRDLTHEEFWVMFLNRRSYVIAVERLHIGGQSSMVVDPKIVFRKALEHKASSIILCHNHPAGLPSPSMEDIRLTERVKQAGGFIDIKVLDHIIIGDGSYFSFADEGKM